MFDGSRGWRGTLMLGESAAGPIPTLQRDDGVLNPEAARFLAYNPQKAKALLRLPI